MAEVEHRHALRNVGMDEWKQGSGRRALGIRRATLYSILREEPTRPDNTGAEAHSESGS
jgi:hypothetical protein